MNMNIHQVEDCVIEEAVGESEAEVKPEREAEGRLSEREEDIEVQALSQALAQVSVH